MASPDPNSNNFYNRLAVEEDASSSDIKAAYAQAVREYSPERHPEQFKRIREAYETLSDAESRAQYDATSNPQVEEALERGQEALQAGDYGEAAASFKRALVLEPEAHFIRNLLGVTFLHQEANKEALEQFERLTQHVPNNHLYWAHLAAAEHGLAQHRAAEEHYRRAIELEPEETSAYQGLAGLLADMEEFEEAEKLLEEAIHADGRVDFEDITLFFELITLRLRQGEIEAIREVTDRIESVITEDWQRTRVAYRFATLAQSLVEFQAFELALALAKSSERLAPGDEDIAQFTKYVRRNRDIIKEFNSLAEDQNVRQNLKALIATILQENFESWDSVRQRETTFENLDKLVANEVTTAVLDNGSKRSFRDELEYVEDVYPKLRNLFRDEYWENLKRGALLTTHVWLRCPHCESQARAQDEKGRYTCPDCGKEFDYESSSGKVRTWSPTVQARGCAQSLASWVIYGVGMLIFFGLVQSC